MRKFNTFALLASLVLVWLLVSSIMAMDPEERMAETQPLLNRVQSLYESLGLKPESSLKQLAVISATVPGTAAAFLADYHAANYYLKEKNYGEFVKLGAKLLESQVGFTSKEIGILSNLSSLLNNAELSPEIKEKAFNLVLPRMGMSPACWFGVANYLKKLELKPACNCNAEALGLPCYCGDAQKFNLACRCAEFAGGKSEETQLYLGDLLRLFSAKQSQPRKLEMYERYLKICGNDGAVTSSPEQCLAQILEWRSKAGDTAAGEQLKSLREGQEAGRLAVQKEANTIIELLGKGQLEDADKAIRELKMNPLRLNNDVCLQVNSSKIFGDLELAKRMDFAASMFKVMQGEKGAAKIYGQFHLKYTREDQAAYFALLDAYIVNSLTNPNWLLTMTGYFGARVNNFPEDIQVQLYECLTHGQEKLALNDLLAQYLLKKAELELDGNPKASLIDLESIMKKCSGMPESAKAGWLHDILTSKGKIVQGPLPRVSDCFTTEYRPEFKLNGAFAKGTDRTLEADMGISPCVAAEFDSEKVQTDGDKATAANAFDAKLDTAWMPGRSQAAVQIPLKSLSSIKQISIRVAGTPQYLVSLLGEDGRVLWKGERCLFFHDTLCSAGQTLPELVTMNFMPVDDVAYLRIEIYAGSPDDGLAEVSIKSPKYPGLHIDTLPVQKLPAGIRSLTASWTSEGAPVSYEITGDNEGVNGYPFSRWRKPWNKKKACSILREQGGNLGISFFGDKVSLRLRGKGGVAWRLDDEKSGRIEKDDTDAELREYPLVEGLEADEHKLQLKSFALAPLKDKYSPKDLVFEGLLISGTPKAFPVVRFECAGKWSTWFCLLNGKNVDVPAGTTCVQTAVVFDQRAAAGMGAASIKGLETKFETSAGENAKSFLTVCPFPSTFDSVVKALQERKLTVVYSKTGTRAEYDAAKRLADKAGVYLVSDDKQLNDYPGATLAIGTVLNNRYNLQLLARENLFANADFLNGGKAWCGSAKDAFGETDFYFICGPDAASIVAMVNKMTESIPQWREPNTRFRLFDASALERIYPWELGTSSNETQELKIALGRNDRRNAQIGIAFDSEAGEIETNCSGLKDQAGHTLPAIGVRYVAFYEWIPFFGDMRVPDLLVEKPLLPIPANTATGIWLTFKTGADVSPGTYSGELAVRVGKETKRVRITVNVLPVSVPRGEEYAFYSYSSVPYWWHLGSANYKKALGELYRNEAEHRLNMVTIDSDAFTWRLVDGAVVFDFSQLIEEIELAERIYTEAAMSPPKFYAGLSPVVQLRNILLWQDTKPDENAMQKIGSEYAAQLTAQLKKTGRWERYYQKVGDEPGAKMEQWVASAKPYRDGGLQVTTAHAVVPQNTLAAGVMSAWCPNYEHDIFDSFLRGRQEAGETLWWYMCTCPSTRITGQLIDSLAFYWLTAKWDFDGGHSYGGLCPPSGGPEATGIPFRYDHGLSSRMLFLPDGTLIDSVRREMESEGIIDCLLIKAAQKKIKGLTGPKAEEYGQRLDAILHSAVPYKRGYAESSAQWEKARLDLYQLLSTLP